jgi:hypothetical protein
MFPLVPMTVTVYVPAVVPLPPVGAAAVCFDPHPTTELAAVIAKISSNSVFNDLRRREGRKKNSAATAVSPPNANRLWKEFRKLASVDAVLLIVNVAVTASAPVMATGAATVQVGRSCAADGLVVIAQLSATVPVKPPLGVTVTVDEAGVPGVAFVIAVPLRAKFGTIAVPLTVTSAVAVCVILPEVPVIVTV